MAQMFGDVQIGGGLKRGEARSRSPLKIRVSVEVIRLTIEAQANLFVL